MKARATQTEMKQRILDAYFVDQQLKIQKNLKKKALFILEDIFIQNEKITPGQTLKLLIDTLILTNKELAVKMNVSHTVISNIITDFRPITLNLIAKMSIALEMDLTNFALIVTKYQLETEINNLKQS